MEITMWEKIDRSEYMKQVKDLKVLESFSDPDGIFSFGKGYPYMETIWGTDPETPVVKCEMSKPDRHSQEWEYEYFLNS